MSQNSETAKSVGIVAGSGHLPIEMLRQAKAEGYRVHVCMIRHEANTEKFNDADSSQSVRLGELGKLVKYFESKNVREIVFGGKVEKPNLLKGEVRPDLTLLSLFAFTKDHKDDTLLGRIADFLTKKGIRVLPSTRFLKESLPEPGVLTKRKPTQEDMANVKFGYEMAKGIAGLDIGQTVAVKNLSVVAVESVEGTDECIRRGGRLVGGDIIVVKVAKPKQDLRFDVPAIGPKTLRALSDAGARLLCFEARKTILIEREEFLRQANEMKLIVLSYGPDDDR